MTLDTLDWATITEAQARRLEGVAVRRRKAVEERYNRFEATDEELSAICWIEEALAVYHRCGAKPDKYCARCGSYVADCRSRQCAESNREPVILWTPA